MNLNELQHLSASAEAELKAATTAEGLEQARVHWLGRKGKLTLLFQSVAQAPPAERPAAGRATNEAKRRLEAVLRERQTALASGSMSAKHVTNIHERVARGHLHPLTQFSRKVIDVWRSLGYDVHEGPELEETKYNFDYLNVPPDHPARDIQDTFFIKDHDNLVLRTHSSTVQLRAFHHAKPPLKFVEVGKVYRHEATDATHESMFTQCDGILIDKHVTMAHLVTTLQIFIERLYPNVKTRIRPSFFPFVEPGIELDMWWVQPGKGGRWLELLGAGLVHPNVIKAMGLKSTEWQGFAFGMGLDRLAMLEYGIPDVRLFYNGNLEFLKQF